ncbi:2-phospho-L-lactate guanylyltransferase [Rhodococcus chondri]|uniref:Phosphoenolpyruvate guanylyltransferase n=1 Tax=Rhodococcus chondri TaxID=3065941 RepID=A0ABU7JWP6_9NOCA|nr:2-phospho-L-lactate guanylyltransferase [Rhodococcus sp. CC-R104]MEE2034445.1 2-phospho-L-lactate guanylyltransferase [Rhodococcus sp. CC-R104]
MTAAHVLIPVKALGLAKSRLAHVLEPEIRADLVLAMLRDTLDATLASGDLDVTIVTSDPHAAAVASACGARVFPDPGPPGAGSTGAERLNAALNAAAAHVRHRTPGIGLIALQADLPALRPHELVSALDDARQVGRAIVEDHTGLGTTALLHCVPHEPLHAMFGADSARRHVESGARALTGDLPGLRLDVDTVADLEAAARLGTGPATASVLVRIGFAVPAK